jgi:DnaK suppressor protein
MMTRHLTPQNLQQLRDTLLARRALLEQQNSANLGGQSRADHARELLLQDGDDDTQRDAEREVDFARTDRDAVSLTEIDQALQRLAADNFGLCTDCGDQIPLERLQLAPQALRCVACESLLERGRPKPAKL